MGAHVLVYPTAIGSEPSEGICGSGTSKDHWRRVMQGHSASNMLPVLAVNRTGVEKVKDGKITSEITFYGSSFGTDNTGKLMDEVTMGGRESKLKQRRAFRSNPFSARFARHAAARRGGGDRVHYG